MSVACGPVAAAHDVPAPAGNAGEAKFLDTLLGGGVGCPEPEGNAFIAAWLRDRGGEEGLQQRVPVGVGGALWVSLLVGAARVPGSSVVAAAVAVAIAIAISVAIVVAIAVATACVVKGG